MTTILLISELYYPEETSTGYFVTGIAEGLAAADGMGVRVLSAQPTYRKRGERAAVRETHHNVRIRRLAAPGGDKNRLPGRLWNAFSLTLRFGWAMLREIKRGDTVLVVTNPPSLPVFAGWIGRMKGARPILLVQDVYPDVLVPVGLTREGSLLYRFVDTFQRGMLRRMTRVVVLGRDMERRIAAKLGGSTDKLTIIPNWGDTDAIGPETRRDNPIRRENALEGKFVVQFSGNLGRTHGLEDLLSLATRFKDDGHVHFFVFGWGAGRAWLEAQIAEGGLTNITLRPPCERDALGLYLTCCDLFFLPFKPGMEGISVPSRMYNVMAAGNPILAVCSDQSELAMVVKEEQIGFVAAPGNIDLMEHYVREAIAEPAELNAISARSRAAAEEKYTRERVVAAYGDLLKET